MVSPVEKMLATMPAKTVLQEARFFSGLNPEQLARVAEISEVKQLDGGSQIYTLGHPAHEFFVLIDGVVRFNLTLGNRQASAGEFIGRGEVFGWAALIEGAQRRIATAACVTPCTVLSVEGDRLLELMEEDNGIGYQLMKQLSILITSKMTAFAAG